MSFYAYHNYIPKSILIKRIKPQNYHFEKSYNVIQ